MRLKAKGLAVLSLAAIALLALFVAACSGDVKEEDLDSANARIDGLEEQATKAQILAFRNALRAEDLHGLQESLEAADEIDESWIGRATRSRQAVASVTWPDDMKDAGAELTATLASLESALSEGNLEDAVTAATDAHSQYHDLEHDASPYIAGETHAPEEEDEAEASATEAAH